MSAPNFCRHYTLAREHRHWHRRKETQAQGLILAPRPVLTLTLAGNGADDVSETTIDIDDYTCNGIGATQASMHVSPRQRQGLAQRRQHPDDRCWHWRRCPVFSANMDVSSVPASALASSPAPISVSGYSPAPQSLNSVVKVWGGVGVDVAGALVDNAVAIRSVADASADARPTLLAAGLAPPHQGLRYCSHLP